MNHQIISIIPVRLNSKRFFQKVIKKINAIPMFVYTYKRIENAPFIEKVYVSTKDKLIIELCKKYKIDFIQNVKEHDSGTSRIIEAMHLKKINAKYILNVQADEPLIDHLSIRILIEKSLVKKKACFTLKKKITTALWEEKKNNQNCVKVITDENNEAKEFFRIKKEPEEQTWKKYCFEHIGIYLYHQEILEKIKSNIENPEIIFANKENLEQVDFMKLGIPIYAFETNSPTISIDTKEDFKALKNYLKKKKN